MSYPFSLTSRASRSPVVGLMSAARLERLLVSYDAVIIFISNKAYRGRALPGTLEPSLGEWPGRPLLSYFF